MTASCVADAIADGALGGRLWLYSNYHCNLACDYCLTDSSPKAPRRALDANRMVHLAEEAATLGFTGVGITGGEPFLRTEMPDILARLAKVLPVIILTNATLFTDKLLARMRPLADLPITLQVSLDAADSGTNDHRRGDGNFDKVIAAIPQLLEIGLKVRIATTGANDDADARKRLCALHTGLGVTDEDHVTRPIVYRGRGCDDTLAVAIDTENLPPELTISADGAYWSPFAPTVRNERVDTDLLISRVTSPLRRPAEAMLHLIGARPPGADAVLGIQ